MSTPISPPSFTPPSVTAAALARLLAAIWAIDLVQKVSFTDENGKLHLWVLLREESLDDEERIALLEREYDETPGVAPLDTHVFPLSEVAEANLPPATTLFSR